VLADFRELCATHEKYVESARRDVKNSLVLFF